MTTQQWILRGVLLLLAIAFVMVGLAIRSTLNRAKTSSLVEVIAGALVRRAELTIEGRGLITPSMLQKVALGLEPPNNAVGLVYTDATGAPLDCWGSRLLIQIEQNAERLTIQVRSNGPDGVAGTTDDMKSMPRTISLVPEAPKE